MKAAESTRFRPGRAIIFMALLGYAGWVIFPMIWVAYSSLKPYAAIFLDTFAQPEAGHLHLENYVRACG